MFLGFSVKQKARSLVTAHPFQYQALARTTGIP
jgi:hypothetical protein